MECACDVETISFVLKLEQRNLRIFVTFFVRPTTTYTYYVVDT